MDLSGVQTTEVFDGRSFTSAWAGQVGGSSLMERRWGPRGDCLPVGVHPSWVSCQGQLRVPPRAESTGVLQTWSDGQCDDFALSSGNGGFEPAGERRESCGTRAQVCGLGGLVSDEHPGFRGRSSSPPRESRFVLEVSLFCSWSSKVKFIGRV